MNSSNVEKFSTSSNNALEVAKAIPSSMPIDKTITALILKLQTSLSVNQVIETFFFSVQSSLKANGIGYEFPLLYKHIQHGEKTDNSYSYLIEIDNDTWGDITIFFAADLNNNLKSRLDEFVSAIIFPLRNAIQYESTVAIAENESNLGLPSWNFLESQITREAKLAIRQKQFLSLVLIDIDHFTQLKEKNGSLFSDIIIRHIYETIQNSLRDTDILYRFGYDQFSLIFREIQASDAAIIAERIKKSLSNHELLDSDNKRVRLTVSIGIAELINNNSVDSLYERTYNALKLAKNSGRNQIKVADGTFLR